MRKGFIEINCEYIPGLRLAFVSPSLIDLLYLFHMRCWRRFPAWNTELENKNHTIALTMLLTVTAAVASAAARRLRNNLQKMCLSFRWSWEVI